MPFKVAVVGTGIMGRRMLAGLERHPEFETPWAWDDEPAARAAASAEHPSVRFTEEVFEQPADLFYVATPPATHIPLARRARNAVLCEKPLAIDVPTARALVEEIRIPNAVNFPFATDPSVATLERILREGHHGEALRLEIRHFFNDWPRTWQRGAAAWLAGPEQGGFLREVFSHFAYLTDRLLGPIEVLDAVVERGSGGTETSVLSELRAGGVRIRLFGAVGGRAPDHNEWTLYGSRASLRLTGWGDVTIGDDDGWRDLSPDRPRAGLSDQLDAVARMLRGHPHPLPTFADALRIQETVESILGGKGPGVSVESGPSNGI